MKKIIKNITKIIAAFLVLVVMHSCQDFDDLQFNPNVASTEQVVPPSRLLNRVLNDIYSGGGVLNTQSGYVHEGPWNVLMRWNQFIVSNDTYYGGNNYYDWSNSSTMYDVLINAKEMEKKANPKNLESNKVNQYSAMAKFLKAYSYIWYTQRVGDIPLTDAGQGLNNLNPKFEKQSDVYRYCLELLDSANNEFNTIINVIKPTPKLEGDIFLGNSLAKWQKVVNTFTLRVLVSLSKRADDSPELKVKERFAAILANSKKYPIMAGIEDNLQFKFNSLYNKYPKVGISGNYNSRHNVSKTYLDLTTKYNDPRTFVIATPAPSLIKAGKKPNDYTAFAGSDNNLPIADLSKNSADGKYSFSNYNRYYKQDVVINNPEPYIIIGYPEMCLNIAEGINLGWTTGEASQWYVKGITGSFDFYGIKNGTVLTIADNAGKTLGTDTVKTTVYFAQTEVIYKGNNADGLKQILEQKYISFFQNSGWEAYYNWRRTGVPVFLEGGVGVNASKKIPRRFQYPPSEKNENNTNYMEAVNSQFNGDDNLYLDVWSVK